MIKKLLMFSMILLIFSCKTGKISRKPLEGKNTTFLLRQLKNNEVKFTSFSAKATIGIQNDKMNSSFKSTIRIYKDSAIWISITPLFGIELARVLLTKDSLKIIDRINAQYFKGDYDYFYNKYKVALDFETIESLLLGNRVAFEENDKLKFSIDKNRYYLGNTKRRKVQRAEKKPKKIKNDELVSLWLNPTNYKIEEMLVSDLTNSRFIKALFSDFINIDENLFPTHLTFFLNAQKEDKVDIAYSRIVLDKPISFSFNIPSKYVQVFY